MKSEFNELVETLKRWELFQTGDDVDIALTKLLNKINEVDKRINCSILSTREISKRLSNYTNDIDSGLLIKMSISDHDSIINSANDVFISLDLDNDMCVFSNWYNLFSPTEEIKPIAVGNIEYDFPEEVYTIGNADNTEIIGDVYESAFNEFLDLGILVLEDSDNFPFGKTNYIVLDNKFISIVKKKQIDLSKVPIKNEASFVVSDESPTMQCRNSETFDKVKEVIQILRTLDNGDCVDGETMEYILRQVGMEGQMLKQLFAQSTIDEIDYLHYVRNGNG